MFKSIVKEIIIMILLCLAIILVFGILFYDEIPLSKVIPDKVSYTIPEEIKTELESDIAIDELQEQSINYTVSAQDLKQYEKSGVYDKGNPNPFQAYTSSGNSLIINGTNANEQSGNSSIQYYPSTSTK